MINFVANLNREAMKEVTKILPINIAGKLQKNAVDYNCRITDLAVTGGDSARISISGTDEDLKLLFETVEITLSDASKKATTV